MVLSSRAYSSFELANLLPWPEKDANKYSRGKLVLFVGCARYPGAAILAARAAQRMGAGYVEVVCAPESMLAVQVASPSLVVRSWNDFAAREYDALPVNTPAKPVAYVVGPGFDGADPECRRIVRRVLEHAQAPVLIDGGGLSALCNEAGQEALRKRVALDGMARENASHSTSALDDTAFNRATVITPHAGEAARLARAVGITPSQLDQPPPSELAAILANSYQTVCVLKGPNTFVSDGENTFLVSEGTQALAKAGTGDVLAGMIGSLLAQSCDAVDASVVAATLHARAGVEAAKKYTQIGVTAEDVIEEIPTVLATLKRR